MKKDKGEKILKLYIEAWYTRTFEIIDMDNGNKVIPPPSKKEWEKGVLKDLKRLLLSQHKERVEILDKFVEEVCKEYLYAEEYLPKAKDKFIKKLKLEQSLYGEEK